tara:strand:+ start:1076 stop:1291 length:216 start_codon:yes stop_codon:yes gene_type:complete
VSNPAEADPVNKSNSNLEKVEEAPRTRVLSQNEMLLPNRTQEKLESRTKVDITIPIWDTKITHDLSLLSVK